MDARKIAREAIPLAVAPVVAYLSWGLATEVAHPLENAIENRVDGVFNRGGSQIVEDETAGEVVDRVSESCETYFGDGETDDVAPVASCIVENGVDVRLADLGDNGYRTDGNKMGIILDPSSLSSAASAAENRAKSPDEKPDEVIRALAGICADLPEVADQAVCLNNEVEVPLGYMISDDAGAVRPANDPDGDRPDELVIEFNNAAVQKQFDALLSVDAEMAIEGGTIAAAHISPEFLQPPDRQNSLGAASLGASALFALGAGFYGWKGARWATHRFI